jgi:5,10-methylenetetrahydromethanopterin reductase
MKLATGVTNVVTRHPAVLAQSFATLDEISNGRAILGVGVGASAVVIVLACTGPKSLELGGRVADGVLFQVGAEPALVEYARHHIDIGARSAGRDPAGIRLYQRLACGISDDREQIRKEVRGYAAVGAGTVFSAVPREYLPEDLRTDLQSMYENYDFQRHGSMDAPHTRFITDRILDAIAIAGTAQEAVPKFRKLMELGVENFVLPVATSEPDVQIHSLTTEVFTHLRQAASPMDKSRMQVADLLAHGRGDRID